jgi:hypothetical protein
MVSRFDRLFVVTYGRSGSTLVQGVLNAIEGYRIYGENDGFLAKLHDAYEALEGARAHLPNPVHDRPSNPWFGASRYEPAMLDAAFSRFVDEILFRPGSDPAARVFGFKEIRHHDLGEDKLSRLLVFTRRLYPRSAIIFNTRQVADVLKSGWWRRDPRPDLPGQLAEFETFCAAYARGNRDHAIHLTYERLVDPARREAARLLEFLGEALAPSRLDAVMAANHSYENRSLTGYLAGRSPYVELREPDWWRANVDEFRIDLEAGLGSGAATGVFLPSVDSAARLWLTSGPGAVEIIGSDPTLRIGELHAGNPRSAAAGFAVEYPAGEELLLFGASRGFDRRLVGVVRPRPAGSAGKGPPR